MKTVTWKIKDSWTETKKAHPGEYTDYLFLNGRVKFGKLFPGTKNIYAIGGHFKGSHIYWQNLTRFDVGNILHPFKQFFLRIDFGKWFITITPLDPDCYQNVDIIRREG